MSKQALQGPLLDRYKNCTAKRELGKHLYVETDEELACSRRFKRCSVCGHRSEDLGTHRKTRETLTKTK